MDTAAIDKRLTGIEALANLMLEECAQVRKEMGLVQAPTPQKGTITKVERMRGLSKRYNSILKKVNR